MIRLVMMVVFLTGFAQAQDLDLSGVNVQWLLSLANDPVTLGVLIFGLVSTVKRDLERRTPPMVWNPWLWRGLALGAGLVVPLLGVDYAGAVPLLRALAALVVLRGLYYLAADMLTGLGRQGIRTVVQVSVLALNVLLNLVLIPTHGVWGAVWATLVCESVLAAVLWSVLLAGARAERRASAGAAR